VKDADKPSYKGGAFLYFPTVAAPITVSFNVSGLDKLNLSQSTLAKVFQAEITKWNDPAIAADNAGATLPDKNIVVVHRADGSGTTNTFTKYLKAATPDWKLDTGDTVQWPASTQQGQGNGGVAKAVKDTDGSIGYVDFSDAVASNLKFASIKNKAGKFVAPSVDAAVAALEKATVAPDLTYSALDTDGDAAYPIVASTYILVYANQTDATKGKAVKGFLTYILNEGQDLAKDANFAKLSDSLKSKAIAQLQQIKVP
jgi:phosphate transport system substrate-binding protein